jgi:hypothetical protein
MKVLRAIGAVLLLAVFMLLLRWPALVTFGIRHDLHEYAKTIRASSRSLGEKEKLLDRIDALEKSLDGGAAVSAFGWKPHNDAIRAMLDDGLTADEVRLVERELEKVERELSQ